MAITFNHNDKLYVSGSNVGIGTDSPTSILHLENAGNTWAKFINTSGTNQRLDVGTNSSSQHFVFGYGAYPVLFGSNGAERMRIDSSGNVGIGTTNPGHKLHVKQNSNSATGIRIENSLDNNGTDDSDAAAEIFFQVASNNGHLRVHGSPTDVASEHQIDLGSTASGSFLTFSPSGSEKVRIDSSGNVGIGKTDPSAPLHINGGSTNQVVKIQSNSAPYIRFKEGGTDVGFIQFGTDTYISNQKDGTLNFRTNNTDKMTILSNGNVGIGTTSPKTQLHLNDGGSYNNTDANNRLFIERDDHAYILMSTPDDKDQGIHFRNDTDNANVGRIAYQHRSTGDSLRFRVGSSSNNNEFLIINSNGSLDFKGYGAGGFKGDATYVLGVDSSGNVVETTTAGVYFGTNTGAGTYTNQWQRVLVIDTTNYDSQVFRLRIEGSGNTSGQSLVAEIEFNFKNQNGAIRARTTVNSYGTHPVDKDDIAVYFDTTNLEATFYFKVTQNYTTPIYSIVSGRIRNYAFYSNVIGDDTALASETNDSITSNLKFQGIVQDQDSGNVGIGTSSPGTKLEVDGTGKFDAIELVNGGGSTTRGLFSDGTQGEVTLISPERVTVLFDSNNNDATSFFAVKKDATDPSNATDLFRVASSGDVGIGSTAPAARLNVASTGANAYSSTITKGTNMKGIINALSNNADDMVGIYFGTGTTSEGTHWSGITGSRSQSATDWSTQLNFYTHDENLSNINDATQKMVIKGNGNVGIGTTNPNAKLEVRSDGSAAGGAEIRLQHANNNSTDVVSTLNFANNVGSVAMIQGGTTGANNTGYISFFTDNVGTSSEKMRILGNGNVGIGTTGPSRDLHIQKSNNGGQVRLQVENTSNTADSTSVISIYNGGADGGDPFLHWKIDAQQDWSMGIDNSDADKLKISKNFGPGTNDYLTVDTSGNVGIGTNNPSYKLDVAGDIFTNSKFVTDSGELLRIYQSSWTGNEDHLVLYNAWKSGTGDYLLLKSSGNQDGNNGAMIIADGNGGRTFFGRHSNEGAALDSSTSPLDETYAFIGSTATYFSSDVGIGTTSPSKKLDVRGEVALDIMPGFQQAGAIRIGRSDGTSRYHEIVAYNDSTNANNYIRFDVHNGTVGSNTGALTLRGNGNVQFPQYGAGYLQTDASGNITAGTITTSDTLDDVTDNGNSTTNSIVLGASTTGGTMLVRGTYTSGNIVVIGGMKSSGGAMIGYGVKPDTATNHGFVSSSAFTLERSAYYQQGNRHRWYAGASQDVAIGNAVTMSETMRLDFDKLGLSTSSPASLIHLGKPTNGTNIITFGEAGIGGPHGIDFYGDDATRTKKYSIYYRTGTENISMETSDGTKRFEINQSGAVTLNEAFTFPTADGSTGAALVTNGSGSLSWNAGYQQYTPVGWGILNNQTYTSTGSNISSNSVQAQAGTTPVQRNSATEFEATKAGWYEISYSFIVKNNYANRAMIGAYMGVSTSGGGGTISGSHSTQYVRYSTYGQYAQIQNTFYYYTSASSTNFYLYAYLLSGSMNMTTQSVSQSMISFRYINNDIT
jgi:hypothetical protein